MGCYFLFKNNCEVYNHFLKISWAPANFKLMEWYMYKTEYVKRRMYYYNRDLLGCAKKPQPYL